jgi:hypothetical protein
MVNHARELRGQENCLRKCIVWILGRNDVPHPPTDSGLSFLSDYSANIARTVGWRMDEVPIGPRYGDPRCIWIAGLYGEDPSAGHAIVMRGSMVRYDPDGLLRGYVSRDAIAYAWVLAPAAAPKLNAWGHVAA